MQNRARESEELGAEQIVTKSMGMFGKDIRGGWSYKKGSGVLGGFQVGEPGLIRSKKCIIDQCVGQGAKLQWLKKLTGCLGQSDADIEVGLLETAHDVYGAVGGYTPCHAQMDPLAGKTGEMCVLV